MIRTVIVGTALFLNLNEHALDQHRHFSTEDAFWFQNQGHAGTTYGKQGSYIKQLLDALALLLVNEPGADTVNACALQKDMSDDEQPSKRARTATGNTVIWQKKLQLVLARNGTFADTNNETLVAHAKYILEFISNGTDTLLDMTSSVG